MLKDPRVDITLSDHRGHTPLWHASFGGSVDVVEWLIASGRELGDLSIVSSSYLNEDIALLLEKFMVNPAQIRHELQVKLGLLDECAAEIFALTVFLCDGLLQLRPGVHQDLACACQRAAARRAALPSDCRDRRVEGPG